MLCYISALFSLKVSIQIVKSCWVKCSVHSFVGLTKSAPVSQCLHSKTIITRSNMLTLDEGISVSYHCTTVEFLKPIFTFMIVWTLAWEVSLVRKYISVCTCSWECMYRGSIARMLVSMCMCTYMCACTQMPEVNTRYLPCSLSPPDFLKQTLSLNQLGLVRELQGSYCLYLHTCAYCHTRHCARVPGVQTQVLMLAWQAHYQMSLPPPLFYM